MWMEVQSKVLVWLIRGGADGCPPGVAKPARFTSRQALVVQWRGGRQSPLLGPASTRYHTLARMVDSPARLVSVLAL